MASASERVFTLPELLEAIILQLPLRDRLIAEGVDRTWRALIQGSPRLQNQPIRKAFATKGVLENILKRLPMRDILFAQRVGKTWREGIKKNDVLQENLFLRKTGHDFIKLRIHNKKWKSFKCKSAAECQAVDAAQGRKFSSPDGTWTWRTSGKKVGMDVVIHGNPLADTVTNDSYGPFYGRDIAAKARGETSLEASDASASWKGMLAVLPPTKSLSIVELSRFHWHTIHASDRSVGVTLGDIAVFTRSFDTTLQDILGSEQWTILGFKSGQEEDSEYYDITDGYSDYDEDDYEQEVLQNSWRF